MDGWVSEWMSEFCIFSSSFSFTSCVCVSVHPMNFCTLIALLLVYFVTHVYVCCVNVFLSSSSTYSSFFFILSCVSLYVFICTKCHINVCTKLVLFDFSSSFFFLLCCKFKQLYMYFIFVMCKCVCVSVCDVCKCNFFYFRIYLYPVCIFLCHRVTFHL